MYRRIYSKLRIRGYFDVRNTNLKSLFTSYQIQSGRINVTAIDLRITVYRRISTKFGMWGYLIQRTTDLMFNLSYIFKSKIKKNSNNKIWRLSFVKWLFIDGFSRNLPYIRYIQNVRPTLTPHVLDFKRNRSSGCSWTASIESWRGRGVSWSQIWFVKM